MPDKTYPPRRGPLDPSRDASPDDIDLYIKDEENNQPRRDKNRKEK